MKGLASLVVLNLITLVISNKFEAFFYTDTCSENLNELAKFIDGDQTILIGDIKCVEYKCTFEYDYFDIEKFRKRLITALIKYYEYAKIFYYLVEPIDWTKQQIDSISENIYTIPNKPYVYVQSPVQKNIFIMNRGSEKHNLYQAIQNLNIKEMYMSFTNFYLMNINSYVTNNIAVKVKETNKRLDYKHTEAIFYTPQFQTYERDRLAQLLNEKGRIIRHSDINCENNTCKFKFKYLTAEEFHDLLLVSLMKYYDNFGVPYILIEVNELKNGSPLDRSKIVKLDVNDDSINIVAVPTPKTRMYWLMEHEHVSQPKMLDLKIIKNLRNIIKTRFSIITLTRPRKKKEDVTYQVRMGKGLRTFEAFLYTNITNKTILNLVALIDKNKKIIHSENIRCVGFKCTFKFKYLTLAEFQNKLLLGFMDFYESLKLDYILVEPNDWEDKRLKTIKTEIVNLYSTHNAEYVAIQSPINSYIWIMSKLHCTNSWLNHIENELNELDLDSVLRGIGSNRKLSFMKSTKMVPHNLGIQKFNSTIYLPINNENELNKLVSYIDEDFRIAYPEDVRCKDYYCEFIFKKIPYDEFSFKLLSALMKYYEEHNIYYLLLEPINWNIKEIGKLYFCEYKQSELVYLTSPVLNYIFVMDRQNGLLASRQIQLRDLQSTLFNDTYIRALNVPQSVTTLNSVSKDKFSFSYNGVVRRLFFSTHCSFF